MVGIVTKLSSKNQVTIPLEIRKVLGIEAHDKIEFVVNDKGAVELQQPRYTLESVLGSVRGIPGESIDLDREIEEAVADEMARKHPLERHR